MDTDQSDGHQSQCTDKSQQAHETAVPLTDTAVTATGTTATADVPAAAGTSAAAAVQSQEAEVDTEAIRDAAVNQYLNEPVLVRESTSENVPQNLSHAYETAAPKNAPEALCVVIHVLVMESGFVSKPPCPQALLPPDWRSPGAYRLSYTHPNCEGASFQTVLVPLGSLVILHGVATVAGNQEERVQMKLRHDDYICPNVTEAAVRTYKNLSKLSRIVKDGLAYKLLQLISEENGVPSLSNLLPELKLTVLRYLDARSLSRMCRVNSDFRVVASQPSLWRKLYLRDIGRRTDNDINQDWKSLYKEKYLQRQRMQEEFRRMTTVVPPFNDRYHPLVPPVPMYPPGFIGGDYDLGPGIGPLGPRPMRPMLPRPRFDPFGPSPEHHFRPGRGGGMWDSGPGRRSGFGTFGSGPKMF